MIQERDPLNEIIKNGSYNLFVKVVDELTLLYLKRNHLNTKHYIRVHDEILNTIERGERTFSEWHCLWLKMKEDVWAI